MAILFVLTLGLLFPAHAVGQTSPTASVRGEVLDARTNAPIANVEVTLVDMTERGIVTTTTTGRTGEFLFSGVEPGQYFLRPQRDGYLDDTEEYVSTASRQFVLEPGQALTDRTLRLGAGGAIAGMVQDEERQGVANTLVSAFRFQYDDIRQVWMWISVQEAMTGERGEFRIGDLPPGRYVVRTTPLSNVPISDSLARLRDSDEFRTLPRSLQRAISTGRMPGRQNPDGPAPIYYPNTSDPLQAARIDVDYGRETYVRITTPIEPAFSIRGAVVNPTPRNRRPVVSLSSRRIRMPGSRSAAIGDDGTFEFRNLAPGTYDINVILSTNESPGTVPAPVPNRPPLPIPPVIPTADPNRLVGHAEVTVVNEDVEDIAIVPEAWAVSGEVLSGGGGTLPGGLFVALRGVGLTMNQPPPSQLDDSAAFQITHVPEGDFRLIVTGLSGGLPDGLPAGWHVESARLGAIDALAPEFRIDRSWVGQPLEIVLGQSSSRLSITAGEVGRPEGAVFVAAVPDAARRHRTDLYRTGWTDERGFLSFDAIVPGQYRVFAWERIANHAWLDPEYITRIESLGELVHVGENGRADVEVRVIR